MMIPYVFFGNLVWVERPIPVPKELQRDHGIRRAWGIVYVVKDHQEPVSDEQPSSQRRYESDYDTV